MIFFGVSAYRSLKTKKKKSKSSSLKVSAAAYGNVRLRECKNTEFVWELNKAAVVELSAYESVRYESFDCS